MKCASGYDDDDDKAFFAASLVTSCYFPACNANV